MKNVVCCKTEENLRNKVDVRFVSNEKDYLKWISKPSSMPQKILDNDLVAIRKRKVILTLKKLASVAMRKLDLSKWLIDKYHDDYIKNKL